MTAKLAALGLLMFMQAPQQINPKDSKLIPEGSLLIDHNAFTVIDSINLQVPPEARDEPFNPVTTVSVSAKQGRVDRLSDAEYKRITDAEEVLAKVKREVAQAHGVVTEESLDRLPLDTTSQYCRSAEDGKVVYCPALDHYEFHGQFLLVNVPQETK